MERTDRMKQDLLKNVKECAEKLSKDELIECLGSVFLFAIDPSDLDGFKDEMNGKPWSGVIISAALGFMMCGLDRREEAIDEKESKITDPLGINAALDPDFRR